MVRRPRQTIQAATITLNMAKTSSRKAGAKGASKTVRLGIHCFIGEPPCRASGFGLVIRNLFARTWVRFWSTEHHAKTPTSEVQNASLSSYRDARDQYDWLKPIKSL